MNQSLIYAAALALTIVIGIAMVGCGSGTSPASSAMSPIPAAGTKTTVTTPNSCGGDVAALVKQHLGRADVVDVRIVGGCHDATIATSLDPSAAAVGQAICDSAAEVAYVSGVKSITVLAANHRELATGIKGAPCIGEP